MQGFSVIFHNRIGEKTVVTGERRVKAGTFHTAVETRIEQPVVVGPKIKLKFRRHHVVIGITAIHAAETRNRTMFWLPFRSRETRHECDHVSREFMILFFADVTHACDTREFLGNIVFVLSENRP